MPLGRRDRVLERVGADALDHRHAVVGEEREPLELVERLSAREPVDATAPGPRRPPVTRLSTGGRARKSRYANRCLNAARPVSVPSSTGIPSPSSSFASVRSMPLEKFESIANGLPVSGKVSRAIAM